MKGDALISETRRFKLPDHHPHRDLNACERSVSFLPVLQ